jgi:hypothetical protein
MADGSPKTLTVPKDVTEIDQLENVSEYEVVRFEAGTVIEVFGPCSFRKFSSLKSLFVPPSVRVIDYLCFFGSPYPFPLESVTFEPGSKLCRIENRGFTGCCSLKSISIPASVEFMEAEGFVGSGIRRLDIDPGNPLYHNVDDFVIKSDESKIILYWGSNAEIVIPDFVQIVGDLSFASCDSIHRVMFASRAQVSSIGPCGFRACKHLESIIFPSCMKSMGERCFGYCSSLRSVTFESVSKLEEIQKGAFHSCARLELISIPASVTHLRASSFRNCVQLRMITFPADSKLKSIDRRAFAGCSSLGPRIILSSVEAIGSECFDGCNSLWSLGFSSPSHLVILEDLPARLPQFTAIPDSVKSLVFRVGMNLDCGYTLTFGLDSQIEDVKLSKAAPRGRPQSFLIFPIARLEYFRSRLEFV